MLLPLNLGICESELDQCAFYRGSLAADGLVFILETDVGFAVDLLLSLAVRVDLGVPEPDTAKLRIALGSSPRNISRAVILDREGNCRETLKEQHASLITILKHQLTLRYGYHVCPGICPFGKRMWGSAILIPAEDVVLDWIGRDILWKEDDERFRVPKMFES